MSELQTRKFPYSNYDVVLIEKEDIIKTINDNIIDKEVALELVNSLEVKASNYLKDKRWASIPYLGNIRIPEGLKPEIKKEFKDAKQFAYETLSKKDYVAFIKEICHDNKLMIKYKGYFNQILAMAVRRDKRKWNNLCRAKGENYASCKMVFGYMVKPMKEDYEYIFETENEIENETND